MGNVVVMKPASYTRLTCLLFADVCRQAGLPPGVFQVLTGPGSMGSLLASHPDVAKVAFTGSTEACGFGGLWVCLYLFVSFFWYVCVCVCVWVFFVCVGDLCMCVYTSSYHFVGVNYTLTHQAPPSPSPYHSTITTTTTPFHRHTTPPSPPHHHHPIISLQHPLHHHVQVGQLLRRSLAGLGKKLSLELGGKSPVVVFEDADLDSVVEGVVQAVWFNQGQVCSAGSRLLVQESVYHDLLLKIKQKMATLRIGASNQQFS